MKRSGILVLVMFGLGATLFGQRLYLGSFEWGAETASAQTVVQVNPVDLPNAKTEPMPPPVREAILIDVADNGLKANREGVSLLLQDRFEDALEQFQKAQNADPSNADTYYNLASTYHRLAKQRNSIEDRKKAEIYFNQCLDRQENHTACYRGLAVLLHEEGRMKEAFLLLERWSDRQRDEADPKIELARLFEETGDKNSAKERLIEALAIEKDNPRALKALAKLENESGNSEGAVATLRQSLLAQGSQPQTTAEYGAVSPFNWYAESPTPVLGATPVSPVAIAPPQAYERCPPSAAFFPQPVNAAPPASVVTEGIQADFGPYSAPSAQELAPAPYNAPSPTTQYPSTPHPAVYQGTPPSAAPVYTINAVPVMPVNEERLRIVCHLDSVPAGNIVDQLRVIFADSLYQIPQPSPMGMVLVAESSSNSLLISGPKSKVEEALRLVKEMDRPAAMLRLEVAITEVDRRTVKKPDEALPEKEKTAEDGANGGLFAVSTAGEGTPLLYAATTTLDNTTAQFTLSRQEQAVAGVLHGPSGTARTFSNVNVGTTIQLTPRISGNHCVLSLEIDDSRTERAEEGNANSESKESSTDGESSESKESNLVQLSTKSTVQLENGKTLTLGGIRGEGKAAKTLLISLTAHIIRVEEAKPAPAEQ